MMDAKVSKLEQGAWKSTGGFVRVRGAREQLRNLGYRNMNALMSQLSSCTTDSERVEGR